MPLQQKLQIKLSQRLILTPSLQQAIKLLPMTTVELLDMLNQEMVENPLLEEISNEEIQQIEKIDTETEPVTENQDNWDDADYEYFFGDYLDNGYRPSVSLGSAESLPIENMLSKPSSLADHLTWQLSAFTDEERLREIGVAIIGNLNDDGYLVASIEEISEMGGWAYEEVESVLALIRGFDPVGVAARELRECLLLQLRHLRFENTPSEIIVREHLKLLESNQISFLARQLELPTEETKHYVEIIRRLDPKPGSRYSRTQSQYVTPDVYVVKVDDQYIARLNEDGLPQLRISPVYRRLLDKNNQNSDETRSYVKEKFRSALWLIKSVDQRQKTIQKVATSIIRFQREFLDYGIEHLYPLVLRDVATDIGMHESTVSRVVNNKYIHTPQGVFEMKYFFHSRIHSTYGANVSSVTIKQRIKRMIESEDSRNPFSDSRIVALLQQEGLVMARRTIAKYREQLRIPTSSSRRFRD